MATSRTGTAEWKQLVKQAKAEAIDQGLNTCPLCNAWLDFKHHGLPNSPELDHIIEHSMGGTNELHNLRIICRACNGKRGGKLGRSKQLQAKREANTKPIEATTKFDW